MGFMRGGMDGWVRYVCEWKGDSEGGYEDRACVGC